MEVMFEYILNITYGSRLAQTFKKGFNATMNKSLSD